MHFIFEIIISCYILREFTRVEEGVVEVEVQMVRL